MTLSRREGEAGLGDQGAHALPDGAPAGRSEREADAELAECELVDDDVHAAVDSQGRRCGDKKLWEELAAEDFAGPIWECFVNELADYGYGVMQAWLRTGAIFEQCRRKGLPIAAPAATWSEDDCHDLATESVIAAIKMYQTKSLPKWAPDGGASLRTYFTGACILVFPTVYRSWQRKQRDQLACHAGGSGADLDDLGAPLSPPPGQPCDLILLRHQIREGLANLDERTRTVIIAHDYGYTHDEIADILSSNEQIVTANNVAQILSRHRRRAQKGEGR
jgi:DNA-directed RNA polymerase specialized sigma24 family protein